MVDDPDFGRRGREIRQSGRKLWQVLGRKRGEQGSGMFDAARGGAESVASVPHSAAQSRSLYVVEGGVLGLASCKHYTAHGPGADLLKGGALASDCIRSAHASRMGTFIGQIKRTLLAGLTDERINPFKIIALETDTARVIPVIAPTASAAFIYIHGATLAV